MKTIFKVLLGLIVLGGIISAITQRNPLGSPTYPSAVSTDNSREATLNKIKIEKWSWYKDGFGNVMVADFLFKNDNDVPVKDLTIKCIHSAHSGTRIDENTRTIYEIVPAHGTKSIKRFNMGFVASQAESSSCSIKDYKAL